jgi:hypothetical protein
MLSAARSFRRRRRDRVLNMPQSRRDEKRAGGPLSSLARRIGLVPAVGIAAPAIAKSRLHNFRRRPRAIDAGRLHFRPVHSQHWNERALRSRKPVRLLFCPRRHVMEIERQRPIGVRLRVVARAHRELVQGVEDEPPPFVDLIRCNRPEAVRWRCETLLESQCITARAVETLSVLSTSVYGYTASSCRFARQLNAATTARFIAPSCRGVYEALIVTFSTRGSRVRGKLSGRASSFRDHLVE